MEAEIDELTETFQKNMKAINKDKQKYLKFCAIELHKAELEAE